MSKKISTLKGTPSKDACKHKKMYKHLFFRFAWLFVQYLCKRSFQEFMNPFCFEFELRPGSAAMLVSSVPVRLAHDVMYMGTLFITYQPHNARRGGTLSTSFCLFFRGFSTRILRRKKVDHKSTGKQPWASLSVSLPPLPPTLLPLPLPLSRYLSI